MEKGPEEFPLRILLLGPPAAGKSAVAVKVLYRWGNLEPRMMQTAQRQMEQRNVTYAQLLSSLLGAQESDQRRHYESPKYVVSITNAPSCRFLPNKSQGACVLLLVSAAWGDFEASWKLLQQQVSFACRLPVRQLVVCVNKMDAMDLPYNVQRYKSIVGKISAHLRRMGRSPHRVAFLPISALHGGNMQDASPEMPWFQGWEIREDAGGTLRGMTLRQLLEAIRLNCRLDSCYTGGAWSPQEEKSLLLAWKAMASPASRSPPCPHVLSVALLHSGIRRSPEQCRSKANSLLNCYIIARLQGRLRTSPFHAELQSILEYEATQCMLWLGRTQPRGQGLTGSACGPSQASPLREEEEPTTPGSSQLRELLLAGEALGTEKGPGVHSGGAQRSPEGRGDLPALPGCLSLPSGRRDQDPDGLLTRLEMKKCERTVWQAGGQTEPGAEEGAPVEGCRCVVYRTAFFATKRKQPAAAVGPQPRPEVPKPLLAVPALRPPVAPCPPPPPAPEAYQLVPYPSPPASFVPCQWRPLALAEPLAQPLALAEPLAQPLAQPLALAEPLLHVDSPCLAFPTARPVPALVPLHFSQVSFCWAPPRSADALTWQYQPAHIYAPLEPVGDWPSSRDQAPPWDGSSLAQPGPPATAAAPSPPQVAPEPGPLVPPPAPPCEPQDPCDPPSAAGPESPSSGTSVSPLLPETPRGSGLGLSAAALLSSLALLDSEEDLEVVSPPGTPLQPLSPPLSTDSGAPPSPQLGGSNGVPSPPWPQLCLGDPSQWQALSPLPCTLPPLSPPGRLRTSSATSHFLHCFLVVAFFFWSLPITGLV